MIPDYHLIIKTLAELDDLRKNLETTVKKRTKEAVERKEKVKRLSEQIILTLAKTIDAKDTYTNGHSERVAVYSREIAGRMGMSEREQQEIGEEILAAISDFPAISIGAKYHHEKYDGTGYPGKIRGEDIPFPAMIIGIADAYDAMTSKRSYRDILPQKVVREEIEKGIGTQFHPECADIMLQMIDGDKNYQMCEH